MDANMGDCVLHLSDEENQGGFMLNDDNTSGDDNDQDDEETTSNGSFTLFSNPNTTIRSQFQEYCEHAKKEFGDFELSESQQIELLDVLKRKKSHLDAYDSIYVWALRFGEKIHPYQGLEAHEKSRSRAQLMEMLFERYNMEPMKLATNIIELPHSKANVKIHSHDLQAVIRSLLTDPRIQDTDYLFFDDNPFARPPENLDYIGDLNTGQAYIDTWEDLIGEEGTNKVLLPIIFYLDGAVTGQFDNLPVEALQFSFGIFNRKARDKDYMWRILGYIPQVSAGLTQGMQMFLNSGHMDSLYMQQNSAVAQHQKASQKQESGGLSEVSDEEGSQSEEEQENVAENWEDELEVNIPAVAAQDFHTVLSSLLEPLVDLQEHGFLWDLKYKGKVYKDVHFIPFVPFVKCDTAEADKLTGSYSNRNKNVSQLCRYCTCPTKDSDDPTFKLNARTMKTQAKIEKLVNKGDLEGLKELSQQYICNAWYPVRFGSHNLQGIHGACPLDMLHTLCLGIFKYTRDCFFEQVGKDSQISKKINAMAELYGNLFSRQSDRDLPRTKFKKGINKGKLMGKEYIGVLLLIAAILRSTKGRSLLREARNTKKYFGQDYQIQDWIILVETLIEWEAWLKKETYPKSLVARCDKKF